jgi:hypothetical protein
MPSTVVASGSVISLSMEYSVVKIPTQSMADSPMPSSYRNSRSRASSCHRSRMERSPSMKSIFAPRSRTVCRRMSRASLAPFFSEA